MQRRADAPKRAGLVAVGLLPHFDGPTDAGECVQCASLCGTTGVPLAPDDSGSHAGAELSHYAGTARDGARRAAADRDADHGRPVQERTRDVRSRANDDSRPPRAPQTRVRMLCVDVPWRHRLTRLAIALVAVTGLDLAFGFLPPVAAERPFHPVHLLEAPLRRALCE